MLVQLFGVTDIFEQVILVSNLCIKGQSTVTCLFCSYNFCAVILRKKIIFTFQLNENCLQQKFFSIAPTTLCTLRYLVYFFPNSWFAEAITLEDMATDSDPSGSRSPFLCLKSIPMSEVQHCTGELTSSILVKRETAKDHERQRRTTRQFSRDSQLPLGFIHKQTHNKYCKSLRCK